MIYYYEFRISLQPMETFRNIIQVAKEDKRSKCCHKTSINWLDQMVYIFLKTHFGDPWPTRKKIHFVIIT
jgi:hypothetical protein